MDLLTISGQTDLLKIIIAQHRIIRLKQKTVIFVTMAGNNFLTQLHSLVSTGSKKNVPIGSILPYIESILSSNNFELISFTHKGIIIEVLSKNILKLTNQFHENLLAMRMDIYTGGSKLKKNTTTVRKNRAEGGGNTTTRKKKKIMGIQTARKEELLNIEELLEKELNSQEKSHADITKEHLMDSHSKREIYLGSKEKEMEFSQIYSYFSQSKINHNFQDDRNKGISLTPFQKQQKVTQQNLSQLQELIFPKSTIKNRKKNENTTVTTKKIKQKITQPLQQKINSFIDLIPSSENRKQQLIKLLNKTKKKKKLQKMSNNLPFVIKDLEEDNFNSFIHSNDNYEDLQKFQADFLSRRGNFYGEKNQYHQISDYGNIFEASKSQEKQGEIPDGNFFMEDSSFLVFEEELERRGKINFNSYVESEQRMDGRQKSKLFYALLCRQVPMKQEQPEFFGEILVSRVS